MLTRPSLTLPDIVLPDEAGTAAAVVLEPEPGVPGAAEPALTPTAPRIPGEDGPVWFSSLVASNHREKHRFRDELVHIKGAWPLLMKQRKGGSTWAPEDKVRLKAMVRSASSVSPYLFIWAIPGSMVLLPFLAGFWTGSAESAPSSAAATRNEPHLAGLCIKSAPSLC